jgi:glyoxylase-like metal-dependent hydrolase (beta-lactamase superfamily II)/rhodanese-related sulfurtransferase
MILKQLFDADTWTYSYLLADEASREAILIDPVIERVDRDLKLIDELGLELKYVLDTHVHADHVTGAGELRQRTGAKTGVAKVMGVACADMALEHGDSLRFGEQELEARATPGHTSGCMTYVVEHQGQTLAFTGDALFVRGCGRTDFQQGDSATLYDSVHEQIFSLPEDTVIYPGHDYRGHTSTSVAEEKALNPRLKVENSKDDFVKIMGELKLANPRLMDVAVPANLGCGLDQDPTETEPCPSEVSPAEAASLEGYRIIDVREVSEFNGPLGHIEGAELVPLGTVEAISQTWDRGQKLLVVCRSGGRSGQACGLLRAKGFARVTNLSGGMTGWRDAHKLEASA